MCEKPTRKLSCLLSQGEIPGAAQVPDEVAEGVSVLVGRATQVFMPPEECRGLAAFVAQAIGMGCFSIFQPASDPRGSRK